MFRHVPRKRDFYRPICSRPRHWYFTVSYTVQVLLKNREWPNNKLSRTGLEKLRLLGSCNNNMRLAIRAGDYSIIWVPCCDQPGLQQRCRIISVVLYSLWLSLAIAFIPHTQANARRSIHRIRLQGNMLVACIFINCSKHPHKESNKKDLGYSKHLFEPEQWLPPHVDFFTICYPYFFFSMFWFLVTLLPLKHFPFLLEKYWISLTFRDSGHSLLETGEPYTVMTLYKNKAEDHLPSLLSSSPLL